MADDVLQERQAMSARQRAVVIALLAVAAVMLGGATALWAHYGTAVFFQTIAAGIAACF